MRYSRRVRVGGAHHAADELFALVRLSADVPQIERRASPSDEQSHHKGDQDEAVRERLGLRVALKTGDHLDEVIAIGFGTSRAIDNGDELVPNVRKLAALVSKFGEQRRGGAFDGAFDNHRELLGGARLRYRRFRCTVTVVPRRGSSIRGTADYRSTALGIHVGGSGGTVAGSGRYLDKPACTVSLSTN